MKKTLLLNSTYEVLSFVSDRKVFKFLALDKVEVISSWDEDIKFGKDIIKYPSVLRLKNFVKIKFRKNVFSRKAVIKRDQYCCQYCGETLTNVNLTIDHIIPKSRGGATSFANCVVCCQYCNNKKSNLTPEEAGMKLLQNNLASILMRVYLVSSGDYWHEDWNDFL
jgi:hypothetical protein